jgi:hypothetical protein
VSDITALPWGLCAEGRVWAVSRGDPWPRQGSNGCPGRQHGPSMQMCAGVSADGDKRSVFIKSAACPKDRANVNMEPHNPVESTPYCLRQGGVHPAR